jgi:ABC-type amino acid transport substrate-binding protein
MDHLAPDMRRIVKRGTLNVAILGNDAFPFFYEALRGGETDSGELEGIDIQIGRSLAAYLGVDVVFDRSSPTFDAVIDQVFEGKADLAIAKLSLTLDRARKVRYSQPYASLRPGLLFNRLALSNMINFDLHQNPVDVVRQLGSDAHLGVIRASSYASFARSAFPKATITEYPDWNSLVDAIIHGRVLAGCRDELAIKHEILMRTNANVQMQSVVIDEWIDEIAVALPWENTVLSKFVDLYLSKTQLSFTADQLLTQFLNTQAKSPASS